MGNRFCLLIDDGDKAVASSTGLWSAIESHYQQFAGKSSGSVRMLTALTLRIGVLAERRERIELLSGKCWLLHGPTCYIGVFLWILKKQSAINHDIHAESRDSDIQMLNIGSFETEVPTASLRHRWSIYIKQYV